MSREQAHGGSAIAAKRNYKLLVDPQLKKGQEKLTRFDGESYSCSNHGQRPVVVRDPRTRTSRLWARREKVDLPVPRYKVDEWYIGAVPPREVTFSKLNDNITKQFMEQLCGKYGKLERVRVYHHPKTNKHMGLAKVVFASIKSASTCIERLHQTSIMGNIINAEMDCKGELLKKLHHKIIKGEMMADTMPDVIKHTQEKPQMRTAHKSRRKSSTEDPRRKSTDNMARRVSVDKPTHGPKTPPADAHVADEEVLLEKPSIPEPTRDVSSPHTSARTSIHTVTCNSDSIPEQVFHGRNPPPVNSLPSVNSLESGYDSHPGSAQVLPDQSPPFGAQTVLNHDDGLHELPERTSFVESSQFERVHEKTESSNNKTLKKRYNAFSEGDQKITDKPKSSGVWTKDLENRIETLIKTQNEKFNLDSNQKSKVMKHVKIERSYSETLQENYVETDHSKTPVSTIKREKTPEDLEDGECSGDDPTEDDAERTVENIPNKNQRTKAKDGNIEHHSDHIPSPTRDYINNSCRRFSRSPSPPFHRVSNHSPSLLLDQPGVDIRSDRHGYGERQDGHRRFSPCPDEYYSRFRHPSPGRPPPEFPGMHFHRDRFEPRPRSPPMFDHRRRPSPSYDHYHRHPRSPGRGRPPSPGFLMRRDLPPGHPEFRRRRTPTPEFDRRRRSISPPRRFPPPILRREYDGSPRRDRLYYSPREMERQRRDMSPRFSEIDRHRRHSPTMHHRRFSNASPTAGDSYKQREHRELPPEFRNRWTRQHSTSPSRSHQRLPGEMHPLHHPSVGRSRSSSPEALNSTPPRIRSPVHMHHDQKPYSPGDLPVEENAQPDGYDHPQTNLAGLDAGNVIKKPSKRNQRESSDHDVPLISLDERLREITGEPPPEPESPVETVEEMEEVSKANEPNSPSVSEDMEISSGGGGSEHGDHIPPHLKQQPHGDVNFRSGPFRPVYPGPPGQMWHYGGPGPHNMWNGYNPRFHMNNQRPMWCGPAVEHSRFPPNMHNGFPPRLPDHGLPDQPFNNQMLPPPPPGWNRPWVHGQHPPVVNPMFPGGPSEEQANNEIHNRDPHEVLGDCILDRVSKELKEIIKRDLNRKVIESMAFRVYESWWDQQQALKNPKPLSAKTPAVGAPAVKGDSVVDVKTEPKPSEPFPKPAGKLPALLNTFDPLNWAKGSLEMDGFRIGLGFRSAISKMPSFRVKKRSPSPTSVSEAKGKLQDSYKSKDGEDKIKEPQRKRIMLDSEGEEEDESEQESSEEDDDEEEHKDGKSRVLEVDDVFSSSSSSSEEEYSSDEDESEDESEEQQEETTKISSIKSESLDSSTLKRPLSIDDDLEPPKKKYKDDDVSTRSVVSVKEKRVDDAVTQAALSLSELHSGKLTTKSNLLPSATEPENSQQNLRHVHPKKRYRLLSKDETRNLDLIAEVSDRLRSDDEMSLMSDKEKAALAVLSEMKTTPERRLSSANRFSESSDSSEQPHHLPTRQLSEGVFSPPILPSMKTNSAAETLQPSESRSLNDTASYRLPSAFNDAQKSGEEELEAVEALLSIKQSQPPIPPLSPSGHMKQNRVDQKPVLKEVTDFASNKRGKLTQEEHDKMIALAQEHNYFAVPPIRELKTRDEVLPAVLQILEEHSYSCRANRLPISTQISRDRQRAKEPLLGPDLLKSRGLSSASAAERVKLRRESKSTKRKLKSQVKREAEAYAEYQRRSEMEEMNILYFMWSTGLDLEDMRYLRYEYEQMLTQANVPQWANDTHWAAHPVTCIPNPDSGASHTSPLKRNRKRRSKKTDQSDLKTHKSGCARSEGYYKVADKTKLIQRRLMYRQADNTDTGGRYGSTATSTTAAAVATEKSREARHMMRRIASEFGSDASDLIKYNQLMYRKKSVKFKRSQIHGWGLFAEETIGADEMVIEYVGQLVRSLVADRREVDYTKKGIGSSYLFRIDTDHIIDATKCGNYARFMNHSCDPSCYAKVITVDGAKKIVIYSKNIIRPSDEITYDYKFPIEDDKIPCFCGSINCRGTLN